MKRRAFLGVVSSGTALYGGCIESADNGDSSESAATESATNSSMAEADDTDRDAELPDETEQEREQDPDLEDHANHETIGPGDTVERVMEVENEDSETDTVLVTLVGIDPDGIPYPDDAGYETVTLEPGESRAVTVSWTPDVAAPEGEYGLRTAVWAEPELEERATQLDERTERNAVTVEKPTGTLSVSTTPSDAMVTVDGTVIESSIDLPVGRYHVTAFHSDYGAVTEAVTVETGETTIELDVIEADREGK